MNFFLLILSSTNFAYRWCSSIARLAPPQIFTNVITPNYHSCLHLYHLFCSGAQSAVPEPVMKCIMRDVFSALAFIHSRSIIHRDIKGANILLSSSGQAKLSKPLQNCLMHLITLILINLLNGS